MYKATLNRRNRGFTLIEMMIVAALISIFAALAVFNIAEQLNNNKAKAAVAECRSIATAMSFANDDLGFFPKLCFLRFGFDELTTYISSMETRSLEYHSINMGDNLPVRLRKNWKQKYMSGSEPGKTVLMFHDSFNGQPEKKMIWPADPFGTPYVAYLMYIDRQVDAAGNVTTDYRFLDGVGQRADYFAGVVSYGRNRVPGLPAEGASPLDVDIRRGSSLFTFVDAKNYILPDTPADYNTGGRRELMIGDVNSGPCNDPTKPCIRQEGSDDRFYEF